MRAPIAEGTKIVMKFVLPVIFRLIGLWEVFCFEKPIVERSFGCVGAGVGSVGEAAFAVFALLFTCFLFNCIVIKSCLIGICL